MNDADLELLSAYLDDALSPEERAVVASRLLTEPTLQEALNQLAQTKYWIRNLPELRPPRSYVLTPTQAKALAGRTRRRATAPWTTWISAAAAAILIIAGVLQFIEVPDQAGAPSAVSGVASVPTEAASAAKPPTETPTPLATRAIGTATQPLPLATPAAELQMDAAASPEFGNAADAAAGAAGSSVQNVPGMTATFPDIAAAMPAPAEQAVGSTTATVTDLFSSAERDQELTIEVTPEVTENATQAAPVMQPEAAPAPGSSQADQVWVGALLILGGALLAVAAFFSLAANRRR